MTKFKNPAVTSFGGNLSKVDREKTGLRAEALKNANLPGPDRYTTDTERAWTLPSPRPRCSCHRTTAHPPNSPPWNRYSIAAANGKLKSASTSARSPTFRFGSSTRNGTCALLMRSCNLSYNWTARGDNALRCCSSAQLSVNTQCSAQLASLTHFPRPDFAE